MRQRFQVSDYGDLIVVVSTLEHKLNSNPAYLGQLFQKETGQPFNEYINQFRMEKAKQLLLNTNLTATEISKKIGFNDSNYFFRLFKKYMGVSPSELRKYVVKRQVSFEVPKTERAEKTDSLD